MFAARVGHWSPCEPGFALILRLVCGPGIQGRGIVAFHFAAVKAVGAMKIREERLAILKFISQQSFILPLFACGTVAVAAFVEFVAAGVAAGRWRAIYSRLRVRLAILVASENVGFVPEGREVDGKIWRQPAAPARPCPVLLRRSAKIREKSNDI